MPVAGAKTWLEPATLASVHDRAMAAAQCLSWAFPCAYAMRTVSVMCDTNGTGLAAASHHGRSLVGFARS